MESRGSPARISCCIGGKYAQRKKIRSHQLTRSLWVQQFKHIGKSHETIRDKRCTMMQMICTVWKRDGWNTNENRMSSSVRFQPARPQLLGGLLNLALVHSLEGIYRSPGAADPNQAKDLLIQNKLRGRRIEERGQRWRDSTHPDCKVGRKCLLPVPASTSHR